MTVERVVMKGDQIKQVIKLVPGYTERLSPSPIWKSLNEFFEGTVDEVSLTVDSDDEVSILYQTVAFHYTCPRVSGTPKKITLSRHGINRHTLTADKGLFRSKVSFRWNPNKILIDPLKEKAIQDLLADGTYTKEDAEQVRENLRLEAELREFK